MKATRRPRKYASVTLSMPRAYAEQLLHLAQQTRQSKSQLVREWIEFFGDFGGPCDDVDLTRETSA